MSRHRVPLSAQIEKERKIPLGERGRNISKVIYGHMKKRLQNELSYFRTHSLSAYAGLMYCRLLSLSLPIPRLLALKSCNATLRYGSGRRWCPALRVWLEIASGHDNVKEGGERKCVG